MKLSRPLFGILLAAVLAPSPVLARPPEIRWAASWAAAPQDAAQAPPSLSTPAPPPEFADQSLRQRMVPTLGGQRVRVRFSNVFGKAPLHIAAASVGRSTGGDAVSPVTLRRLRFRGRRDVTIPAGGQTWSDAARFEVVAGQAVAVSFHLDASTPAATVHRLPQEAGSTVPGNAVLRARWHDAKPLERNHVVTGLDVASTRMSRVVVAFGDSITSGAGIDENNRLAASYPSRLATRLRGAPLEAGSFAVVNAGIAGNRLLAHQIGPGGLERFDRDALEQSGVTHVVILIGINDIGFGLPEGTAPAFPPVSADQLTEGLKQLMSQAREKGVKVLLGTLTPFKGAAYWSEEKEARRQAVNRWIRGRQDVDAVVDFDAALRDPADPAALNPFYDSGDHLHPGNAGYAAMAEAIDPVELKE